MLKPPLATGRPTSHRDCFLISVVIPARNASKTIARAVTSAAQQTQPAIEIIVVDDGSTDGTSSILRDVAAPGLVHVRTLGIGVAGARNSGVQSATGYWVAFLDADDYWDARFLAAASAVISRSSSPLACFAAARHVSETGRVIACPRLPFKVTFEELVRGRVVPTTSATIVRRDAFLESGAFFEGFESAAGCEDIDLWFRLAGRGQCVGQPVPLATYVVHDSRDANRPRDDLRMLERDRELVIERLRARGAPPELLNEGYAVMRARTGRYWLRAGYTLEARRVARASLQVRPTREGMIIFAASFLPRAVREFSRELLRFLRAKALA